MQLTDTHAHLFWESFKEDFDQVITRCLEAGVTTIINVGVDLNTSDIVRKLTTDKLQFYGSVGIHPEDVVNYSSPQDVSIHQDISGLEELIKANISNPTKIIAIGECGLDYLFANNPWTPPSPNSQIPPVKSNLTAKQIRDLQKAVLQAQLKLAKKLNLPLLIHCRDDRSKDPENSAAWDEVIELTKNHFGIYHCYSGLPQTTNSILDSTRFLISFAGNITYPKNDYLRAAAKTIPLDRLALETDCPFLSPQTKRGQRNEPNGVLEVAKTIAELKGLSLEQIADQTTKNIKQLFNI